MKNEKGSILVITLGFVLVFTSLGLASLYHAGNQNQSAERLEASAEAFWLADGAVQRAKSYIPNLMLPGDYENIGEGSGTYSVTSVMDGTSSFLWNVEAKGYVQKDQDKDGNPIIWSRAIRAQIAGFGIPGVLNTNGDIKKYDDSTGECSFPTAVDIECDKVDANIGFNFNTFFPNVNFAAIVPDDTYSDTVPPADPTHFSNLVPLSGVTFINLENTNVAQFPSSNPIQGSGFLYIDLTVANDPLVNPPDGIEPDLRMEIADFSGIIYVAGQGQLKIRGNPDFNGAIFVEGTLETRVEGNADLGYDITAIDDALDEICDSPGACDGPPGNVAIIAWEEVPPEELF